jgi:hypothetical protein
MSIGTDEGRERWLDLLRGLGVDPIQAGQKFEEICKPNAGPGRFYYLVMDNGVVFSPMEMSLEAVPDDAEPTETIGIPMADLLNRRIKALARDDLFGPLVILSAPLVILEGGLFLKDHNDGFYGNWLDADFLSKKYAPEELKGFIDYWTEQPMPAAEFGP